MFTAKLAKVRCLKDELAECKSDYANLEAVAAKLRSYTQRPFLAMEAKYVSRVSSLEGELESVVVASCPSCQVAYAQPGGPTFALEVAA